MGSKNGERLYSGVHSSLSRYVVLGSKGSESAPILGSDNQTSKLVLFVDILKELGDFNASPINSPWHM